MNSEHPKVLMVIPTLGQRNDLLKLTLESLKAQAPYKFDIVLVFPKTNKETMRLAKKYAAMTADDPGSISAALNVGIAQAKPYHTYIGWVGDDDLLRENALATSTKALDNYPRAVVAYGYCDYINEQGQHIMTNHASNLAPWIMRWGPNLVPMPSVLIRKSALNSAGIFDVNNKYSMDLDMLLRLRKLGPFINTRQVLAAFRWHSSSTTVANRKASLDEAEKVKRNYLPSYIRWAAPLWEKPVRIATFAAAKRVTKSARPSSKLSSS